METSQNVSAQLYFNQLPTEKTNDFESDKLIENAFQSQLNLSEYYKSPGVFNKMKELYLDKTMEGSAAPEPELTPTQKIDLPVPKVIVPSKSTFGSVDNNMLLIALVVLLIVLGYFVFIKKS